jgi:hypothetical protein
MVYYVRFIYLISNLEFKQKSIHIQIVWALRAMGNKKKRMLWVLSDDTDEKMHIERR